MNFKNYDEWKLASPPEPEYDQTISRLDSMDFTIDEVQDVIIKGIISSEYPEFTNAYIESANWADNGESLNEVELDRLNDNSDDYIKEEALQMSL